MNEQERPAFGGPSVPLDDVEPRPAPHAEAVPAPPSLASRDSDAWLSPYGEDPADPREWTDSSFSGGWSSMTAEAVPQRPSRVTGLLIWGFFLLIVALLYSLTFVMQWTEADEVVRRPPVKQSPRSPAPP